ncbi:MAG: DNA polymerase I [Candidatus Omnitrophota bacterium]
MSEKKLYLLDAHALCYRAFYAIKGLTNSQGQPTNAVYGFTNTLRKILNDFHPEYLAVCFDKDGKGFRQTKYADYKIQRPVMPEDLRSQMPLIHDVVRAYALPVLEISGYEADDLIAAAVKMFAGRDVDVMVITDDKDLFQLVNQHVKVYSPRKEQLLGDNDVYEALGVQPRYISDFIGLAGDSSDNIPGVAGIGKVTAQKLINEFGDLEKIYNSLDRISSGSLVKKLQDQKTEAFLSRELAQLRDDAPINVMLQDLQIGRENSEKLYELFTQLEFHRFAADLKPAEPGFEADKGKHLSPISKENFFCDVRNKKLMAFCFQPEESRFVLTDGKSVIEMSPAEILESDGAIFENPDIVKVTYDIKQQYKIFWASGIDVKGPVFDLMLAGYVLNPVRNGHELAVLSWNFLKQMRPADASLIDDLQTIFRLYEPVAEALEKREAGKLFHEIEMPLSRLLARIELSGVRLDIGLLKQLSDDCAKKMDGLQREIYLTAGEEFNINSPKQLACILFQKLKLPAIKRTKTGFSTNEEVLQRLAEKHVLPRMIIEFRQLAKLKSTYIDALPELAQVSSDGNRKDVIHTSFNQTMTETGRLSSSNPNLQNIPIRTELGREIRRAFIPLENNHLMLSADYSQIELRILAHLSGDENLISAFRKGEDIHAFTAGLMFECPTEKVADAMRNAAKRVNFGIIYGMSAFGLSKDLNISVSDAQDFIDRYFLRYPQVKRFMEQAVDHCRETGYAVTMMNRRRDIPEIVSKNVNMRMFAERQAINTPVQGTAADLIKLAMVNVQRRLDREKLNSNMLITVHDEIVFDLVPSEKQKMIAAVKQEMESAMVLNVPIKVSIKIGKNWLEMEKAA